MALAIKRRSRGQPHSNYSISPADKTRVLTLSTLYGLTGFIGELGSRPHSTAREYVDQGISGTKDRRPALDQLVRDVKRRKFDVLFCWRLDHLGRSLRHLILLLDELTALDVKFVSLAESIDTGTPAGRLQLHLLAAIAQFERERIVERVAAGLQRARNEGKRLGRPYCPGPHGSPCLGAAPIFDRRGCQCQGVSVHAEALAKAGPTILLCSCLTFASNHATSGPGWRAEAGARNHLIVGHP